MYLALRGVTLFSDICPHTIFVNNSRTPALILNIFSGKNLYAPEKLYIKFEACGSHSFDVIVNCVILQGVTHLNATS